MQPRTPVNPRPAAWNLSREPPGTAAADAREAATRTWAATSLFASRFIYTTCYTVSYGVVFPVMLLARAIPQNNTCRPGPDRRCPCGDPQGRADPVRGERSAERDGDTLTRPGLSPGHDPLRYL